MGNVHKCFKIFDEDCSLFVILKATEVSKAYERKDTYLGILAPIHLFQAGKCKSSRVLYSYIP